MPIQTLLDPEPSAWTALVDGAPTVVLYKHSPTCGLSEIALEEVRRFVATHPDVPVHLVDVLGNRAASNHLEATLGIRHESPQAIVFSAGRPVWHGSHRRVTAAKLGEALTEAAAG